MNRKLLLVFILSFTLWTPINGQAHSHDEEVQTFLLNFIMDDALWLAQTERYVEAQNLLEMFSEEFTKMMTVNPELHMSEVRIISVAHQQTMNSLSDTTLPHEEKMRQLKKMRLVVDAMTSEHQPMWVAMEDPFIMTFHQLKDTIDTRDAANYQEMYQRLLLEYDMIHPSVRMDIKPEQIQKVDAHMEYLDKNREALLAHSEEFNDVEVIEADFKALFKEFKEDDTDPALLWVMISTGSIIFMTLFYVGFRKYIATQKMELRKKQKD